jgi:hypothetical protein
MHVLRLCIVLACLTLIGCDTKTPPAPPVVDPPAKSGTINGTERIGWEQPAADAKELAKVGYVIYVDGTRTALTEVSCATSPTSTSPTAFACSARLPAIAPGDHTLELATFVNDHGVRETAHSAPLNVTVAPVAKPGAQGFRPATSVTAGIAVPA